MLIKKTNSNLNSLRHRIDIEKSLLSKNSKICKLLSKGKKKQSGRCRSNGRITLWHRGGGVKSLLRNIKFPMSKSHCLQILAYYDAKRSSFVSLCYNFIDSKFYNTLYTENTYAGSFLSSYSTYPEYGLGFLFKLGEVPAGSIIHSIICNKDHVKYIKAAGTYGIILFKDLNICRVKLPSNVIKTFSSDCFCTLGSLANKVHNLTVVGKAGRSRLKNKRPHVRGVAMNPIDHPHGGQTSVGCPTVTPWGLPAKGVSTKNKYVKSKVERALF